MSLKLKVKSYEVKTSEALKTSEDQMFIHLSIYYIHYSLINFLVDIIL